MIRLRKGAPPDVLAEKASQWTKEFLDALNDTSKMSKTIRFRYRHADIKAAVRRDSHNKCIYCEGLVEFGETEHFIPVSVLPDQILVWENLGLVCKECNTYKSDYYAPAEPLVNPFIDDPADHLVFLGPYIAPDLNDGMGLRTILQLKLNRIDLIQKRTTRLDRLIPLAKQWNAYQDGPTKNLLRQALLDEAADAKDYAATVRGYLRHVLGWESTA